MFMRVVNSQLDRDLPESRAFASAWSALKNAGYRKNKDGKYIKKDDMPESTKEALRNKVKEHNEEHGSDSSKRATLGMLQRVYRRGVGAYRTNPESVRPNVSSPEQWAMGRVNDFLRILSGSRKTNLYDRDLLPAGHPKRSETEKSLPSLSAVNTPSADLDKAEMYQPPKGAKSNAQRVLDWKEKYGDEVNGMTEVGWRRARQLASGEPVSRDVVSRMAQFNRHRDNAKIEEEHKGTPWKDAGYVAWLGWGGDAGVDWARRKMDEIQKAHGARRLYAYHPVLNAEDIIQWAKANGFESTYPPEELHVTVMHSPEPTLWEDDSLPYSGMRIDGGVREMMTLGERSAALAFDAPDLVEEWVALRRSGNGWTSPSYTPHITISQSPPANLDEIEPYDGPIILGGLVMEEVREDSPIEKRPVGDDQFTTPQEARERSYAMGCNGEIHVHDTEDGAFYMPGQSHEAYLEQKAEGIGSPKGNSELERAVQTIMDSVLSKSFTIRADVVKSDKEQQIVYGWASVVSVDGEPVVDKQGHIISSEEMEKMANDFMMSERTAKAMHTGDSVGSIIHSVPLTKELAKALGADTRVEGWLIGVKVSDDEVWKQVKDGTFKAFSIGGKGKLRDA
jgi:hypothetical protein